MGQGLLVPGFQHPENQLPCLRLCGGVGLEQGLGREEDIELVLDACDNVSPGLGWPPKQTTICVLGPSIPSAIVSVAKLFRDELLVHVKDGVGREIQRYRRA